MLFELAPLNESFLTIITATYNSSKYICNCLNSLQSACLKVKNTKISHIVVDAESQDDTVKLIRENSPASIIFQRPKKGIYDALNYGVYLVKSPYVMYLHSDDELDEKFINLMLKKIQNYSINLPIICYGSVDFIDENSQVLFTRNPPFYVSFIQKYVNLILHPNAIYSTSLET